MAIKCTVTTDLQAKDTIGSSAFLRLRHQLNADALIFLCVAITDIFSPFLTLFKNCLKIDTLLDFFCKDFPNVIAYKLISLLSDSNSPSSKGWQIYTTVNEIARNYAINSSSGIDYNFSKLLDLIFNDHASWINWYRNIVNSSKVYSYWKNELNLNQSLITHDELNNLFDRK